MFGTSGIRGEFGTDVTAGLALDAGRAVASAGASRVVLGRDGRPTGKPLSDAVAAGLSECGADVVRLGVVASPTVARAVGWHDADAGVTVTGSHNPPTDNGIKFWGESGRAMVGRRQAKLVRRMERDEYEVRRWDEVGSVSTATDAVSRHVDAIADDGAVSDLDVVLDVGNGTGGLSAEALRRTGCRVRTLDADRDGSFPVRPSEPTAENCARLAAVVAGSDADLGVAHDGDADRMMAVTESGTFVSGDALLAVFAREAAEAGDEVAVPVDTSIVVSEALEAIGATPSHTKVGDGHVAARAALDGVVFGGEPSGVWIWPGVTPCPDGPLAAVRLAKLVARRGSFDDLIDDVPSASIRRGSVETEDRETVVDRVRGYVAGRYPDTTALDGVRVNVDDGWFLVRASGTQPLVRVTAEARTEDRVDSLFRTAKCLVDRATADIELKI